jgi:hypothetical protein
MRASGKWTWVGRVLALLIAVVVPACNNSNPRNGSGSSNGILWLSSTSSGGNTGGPQPTGSALWVDPNSGLGGGQIGIQQIIQSSDDVTYNRFNASTKPPPYTQYISYILGNEHPLSTDTSSTPITQRESELQGMLNGLRNGTLIICVHLPNATGGGGGGGGGLGGIGGVGLTQGTIPGHARGTKSARAHCKHYAYFHTGKLPGGENPGLPGGADLSGDVAPVHFIGAMRNFEGDKLLKTDPPYDPVTNPAYMDSATILGNAALQANPLSNRGRLGKIGVTAAQNGYCEFSYSGVAYKEAIDVYNAMLQDAPDVLIFTNWTNLATGHWRGGTEAFYWSTMYIIFPNPAY